LLHYWELYLSREDVKPIQQGHHLINPADDIDLRAAEENNAENLLVIHDRKLASLYVKTQYDESRFGNLLV
jgi:hypothetical protein